MKRFGGGWSMAKECDKNPNAGVIRLLAIEDLPLLKMLATNGKYKPSE